MEHRFITKLIRSRSDSAYRGSPRNARNGETPDPNTRTALQLEAVEPHTIAIIAILFSREIYRC
jgi:hypothetical protein